MMKRVELNDSMMAQVTGGGYRIYDADTGDFLSMCSYKDDAREVALTYAKRGYKLEICIDSTFCDDSSMAGVYVLDFTTNQLIMLESYEHEYDNYPID